MHFETADVFHDEHPEIQIDCFGGSGACSMGQSGAPADMFFSASQSDFDVWLKMGKLYRTLESTADE